MIEAILPAAAPAASILLVPYKGKTHAFTVDTEDVARIHALGNWNVSGGRKRYLQHCARRNGKRYNALLHRFLLGVDDPKMQVDHINRDTTDNRKANLRVVQPRQNSLNRTTPTVKPCDGGWTAEVISYGQHYRLGVHPTYEEAAAAYYGACAVLSQAHEATNG